MIKGITDKIVRPIIGKVSIGFTVEAISKDKKVYRKPEKSNSFIFWRKPRPGEEKRAEKESNDGRWVIDKDIHKKLNDWDRDKQDIGFSQTALKIAFIGHPKTQVEDVWQTMLAMSSKTHMGCYCENGKDAIRQLNPDDQPKIIPCPFDQCEYYIKGLCKPFGRLYFTPEINPTYPGLYMIKTTSYWSISHINSLLVDLYGLRGQITDIPIMMSVSPQIAHPYIIINGVKKKITTTIYVLKLELIPIETPGLKQLTGAILNEKISEAPIIRPEKDIEGDIIDLATEFTNPEPESATEVIEQPSEPKPPVKNGNYKELFEKLAIEHRELANDLLKKTGCKDKAVYNKLTEAQFEDLFNMLEVEIKSIESEVE